MPSCMHIKKEELASSFLASYANSLLTSYRFSNPSKEKGKEGGDDADVDLDPESLVSAICDEWDGFCSFRDWGALIVPSIPRPNQRELVGDVENLVIFESIVEKKRRKNLDGKSQRMLAW